MKIAGFQKFWVALLTAIGGWGVTASADGRFDVAEWFGLLVAVGGAFGVRRIANQPGGERGESTLTTVCVALIALVVVLWALGADLPASVL